MGELDKPRRRTSARKPYVLNAQVGFLLRVAMQRHTAIFTSRMIADLTQTQFAALAKLFEVGPTIYTPGTKMPEQRITDPDDRRALVEWLARVTKP